MSGFRIEHDLLGDKEVPKDAYYGIQTLRAVENFNITGHKPHPELFLAVAMVKKAAAMANMELGLLDERKGKAIIYAADEILAGKLADQFVVDAIQGGAGTSINMNVNEVIANRAIEILGGEKGDYTIISPNTDVNMSQSTNDVFPTAIRIATIKLTKNLLDEIKLLQNALLKKAKELDDVVKIGRTHLQDAVPIRMGQEFEAYSRAIGRDVNRIKTSLKALHEINLGATAVGTGLNAKVEYIELAVKYLKEISGLPLKKTESLVDATQNTDALADFSSTLKILALNLSKIANDLRLMASGPRAGIAEIKLPPMQPGSSIMPGKVNPVIPEVVNQVAFQVMGNDHTISLAAGAGQLELNVMEPVIVYNLLQSVEILTNAIRTFREKCIVGITANKEHCREMVEKSIGIITALLPHIGYEKASQIAKELSESDETVQEILLRKKILPEDIIEEILSPKAMTEPGILCE